jgi:acetyltransferase-like isoleucine patch superfamily enzyme
MKLLEKINKFIRLPLSRKIEYASYSYHKALTYLFYKMRFQHIGRSCVVKCPLYITPEFIDFGDNVKIGYHARIEAIDSFNGQNYAPKIVFEDGVTLQQRCHIAAAGTLTIGKNTMVSFDVMITDVDHEYLSIGIPIGSQNLIVKKTKIGDNCFIGAGAKIQAGTLLGRQCIVGSNSVVRGVFPDFSVIVGAPAKVIKRYNPRTSEWEKTDHQGLYLE